MCFQFTLNDTGWQMNETEDSMYKTGGCTNLDDNTLNPIKE